MPKTLSNAQHDFVYETIAKAEGEECIVCHFDHFIPRKTERRKYKSPRGYKLEIDHADGDRTNWDWSNLHLVCKKHNCALRGMMISKHVTLMRGYSMTLKREREREGHPTYKSVLKELINYEKAGPELRLNRTYEQAWLNCLRSLLTATGFIDRKEAVSSCAAHVDCSIQTSTNYLIKHTSSLGAFEEKQDGNGSRIIVYRAVPVIKPPPWAPRGVLSKAKDARGG